MSTNRNKLIDLRDHLFEQLERLESAENLDQEIRRAQAMAKVAVQIVNSVKVQLDFINTLGQDRIPALAEQTKEFFQVPAAPKGLATGKELGAPQIVKNGTK